jgi:hypothetical protein
MTKKSKIWYGYLEAGAKSSPVLMDPKLDTGSSDTMYLYNLKRDQILEYQRALIEPKLQGLNGKDAVTVEALTKAFNKIRKEFTPRHSSSKTIVDAPAVPAKKTPEPDIDLEGVDDTDIDLDDDIDLDSDD